MLKIAFRCDASIQMGSGHVMRCLTLAHELRERGADITFICREHRGHYFEQIESLNYRLARLPAGVHPSQGNLAHSGWLGVTQKEDARQTATLLNDVGNLDWLIVDHYALDIEWERAMRGCARHIMAIDDLADRIHDCDVLLDQNLHHEDMESKYDRLVPRHCIKLLGPKYAMLRAEFGEARKKLAIRDGTVSRVLVFMGGSDPGNGTAKALRAIQQLGRPEIGVDVVVGAANPNQEEIAELCATLPAAMLHRQVSNMAELTASADIAIGAGGSAMWERCSLGLPTVLVSIADNQQSGCEALARLGAALYLGDIAHTSEELMKAAMLVATASPGFLKGVADTCLQLADGRGAWRVARQLLAPEIELRSATFADCEPMFIWRNAEETRRFSNSTGLISLDEHRDWFRKTISNPHCQILIGEVSQQAVGVIRFNREGDCATASVYLVPGSYGLGIGGRLIKQGASWVEQHWPSVKSIKAIIKEDNRASISAFSEAGFKKQSCTYARYVGNAI